MGVFYVSPLWWSQWLQRATAVCLQVGKSAPVKANMVMWSLPGSMNKHVYIHEQNP